MTHNKGICGINAERILKKSDQLNLGQAISRSRSFRTNHDRYHTGYLTGSLIYPIQNQ